MSLSDIYMVSVTALHVLDAYKLVFDIVSDVMDVQLPGVCGLSQLLLQLAPS